MRHAALLDAVRALRWPARRRVHGSIPGSHLARLRGPGGEFSEYRAYRQGDDPRRLDWRLLARSDRAYVRLADDHALLPTWLVVDGSASMAFPGDDLAGHHGVPAAARWAKWRLAERLAIGLAAVALRAGDPTGLVVASGGAVRTVPARSRRGILGELDGALVATEPAGAPALAPTLAPFGPSARVAIVSDFLGDDADALRRAAAALAAAGADVYAVHVVAREELAPPTGSVLLEDPERPTVRRPLDGGAGAAARREYLERFASWRADLARAWRDAGAAYALVRTDEDPARAVRRIVTGATAPAEPTPGERLDARGTA